MNSRLNRRGLIKLGVAAATIASLPGCRSTDQNRGSAKRQARLFFTTQGRTALINADGTGLRYFDFKVPDQVTWQPGPFLSDGRRVIFLSMEARGDGPGRPFGEYYHKTPTRLWLYDPDHLYFGPSWSPDGQWLLFQDCAFKADPGHDWCDLCLARPDGSEMRVLTTGQPMWFAATYGNPNNRGGGSNVARWTPRVTTHAC